MQPLVLTNRDLTFDVDDVMAEFSEGICEVMNEMGDHATPDDYHTYNFPSYHNLSTEQFFEAINGSKIFSKVNTCRGAVQAINIIRGKGFRIHFVTAREKFDNAFAMTEQWLNDIGVNYDSLTVMGDANHSKAHYYNQLPNGSAIIVDDAVHNIVDAIDNGNGVMPFLMCRPWNRKDPVARQLESEGKMVRITSLIELANAIELCETLKAA